MTHAEERAHCERLAGYPETQDPVQRAIWGTGLAHLTREQVRDLLLRERAAVRAEYQGKISELQQDLNECRDEEYSASENAEYWYHEWQKLKPAGS